MKVCWSLVVLICNKLEECEVFVVRLASLASLELSYVSLGISLASEFQILQSFG